MTVRVYQNSIEVLGGVTFTPGVRLYQAAMEVLGGVGITPAVRLYQTAIEVLGTNEVISEPEPEPSPSGTQHIFYISGSSSRQGSAVVSTSPLNSIKIQKTAKLHQIPEDRFNDTTYYFS